MLIDGDAYPHPSWLPMALDAIEPPLDRSHSRVGLSPIQSATCLSTTPAHLRGWVTVSGGIAATHLFDGVGFLIGLQGAPPVRR